MLHGKVEDVSMDKVNSSTISNSSSSQLNSQTLVKKNTVGFNFSTTNTIAHEKKITEDEFMAAAIGDVEWLRQSLRGNKGLINFDKNGLSALHLASVHGRLDCLRLLVEKLKQNINMASSTGWRPVHLAISNQTGRRSLNCLSYLLHKGADPSVLNDDSISPMHQAASEGHVQCMKLLLASGAVVDGKDCRGHTPLDLAKLWGHKHCARMLAAEMWHQDKDIIAKEMHQLQKVKMQQVLKEIEADEMHHCEQRYYGDLAFNQWLSNDHSPKDPTALPPLIIPSKSRFEMKQDLKNDSLTRSNSKRPKSVTSMKEGMVKPDRSVTGRKDVTMSAKEEEGKGAATKKAVEHVRKQPAPEKSPQFMNQNKWIKSPKVNPATYVSILKDHYPRDEYTMLPKYPTERLVKHKFAIQLGKVPSSRGTDKIHPCMPNVSAEVIDKVLSKEVGKQRQVVFKCKSIIDVPKVQHYDPDRDMIPRTEVGLHMTNDVKMHTFQMALQPRNIPYASTSGSSSSKCSPSSSSTSVDAQSDKEYVASVMNMIHKNLTDNCSQMTKAPQDFNEPSQMVA